MANATSPQLTTPATAISRVKYFPLEVYCVNMLPNTTYDCYSNGVLINAFCKPYGGGLGAPLTANSSGKIIFQYHMAMPHSQNYVVKPMANVNSSLVSSQIVLSLVDPFGHSSAVVVPLTLKSGTAQ